MKNFGVIVVLVVTIIYFYTRPPSPESIIRQVRIDLESGVIKYKEVKYSADWSEVTEHKGDLRYIGRAYDSNAPFITHDAIVTTGQFSDPDLVTVTPIRKGNMYYYTKEQNLKGSLIVLHFIPSSMEILRTISKLKEGNSVRFIGREDIGSKIEGTDGSFIALGHSNHRFLLVERVEPVGGDL